MYLRQIGWKVVDWLYLAQDRNKSWALVKKVVKFRTPQKCQLLKNDCFMELVRRIL
jgi:hypothetical protein